MLPVTWFGLPEVFLCRQRIAVVLLHRCQNAQIALYAAVVVVNDVVLNHGNKFLTACESFAVIPFPLENAPESFHRAIVDTFGYSGHALLHLRFLQLIVENSVGILKTSVTVE